MQRMRELKSAMYTTFSEGGLHVRVLLAMDCNERWGYLGTLHSLRRTGNAPYSVGVMLHAAWCL
jgi:hypothetical protein